MTQISKVQALLNEIEQSRGEFEKAKAPQLSTDRFLRSLRTYIMSRPDVAEAERNSFMHACLRAAYYGLVVDGEEATINARRTKDGGSRATFEAGYQGYLKMMRNSGMLTDLNLECVWEGDEFERWSDENGVHFKHKPKDGNPNAGKGDKLTFVYGIARTKDGGRYIEIMTRADVEKCRNVSRNSQKGPWVDWYDRMAKKTLIKRLGKILPRSSDVDLLIKEDDLADTFDADDAPPPAPAPQTTSPRLHKAIGRAPEAPVQMPVAEPDQEETQAMESPL